LISSIFFASFAFFFSIALIFASFFFATFGLILISFFFASFGLI